jgi:hypothetical protein
VDAAASGAQVIAGRFFQNCERSNGELTNGAEAYDKTVWSWHPLLMLNRRRFCEPDRVRQGRQFADDGGKNEFVAGESTA